MSEIWAILSTSLVLSGVLMYLALQVRYRIGVVALEITLFGFCLRRVAFSNIRRIGRLRGGWCELWPNTLNPGRRMVVVELRTGWPRYIMITPHQPFAFKGELERAIGLRPPLFDLQKLENPEPSAT
ncbi:MAG: hypothetical protein H7X97_01165 [Opitutaceae bacterium]|nr:hypothetical protein [Verrucomicrobiales bacterium]